MKRLKNIKDDIIIIFIIAMAFISMPFLLLFRKYHYKPKGLIREYNKKNKCNIIYLKQYYRNWSDKNTTITIIYEKDDELFIDDINNKFILFERTYSDNSIIFCEIDEYSDDTFGRFKYKNYIISINYTDDSFMSIENIDIKKY